jgi:hypothetical protein
LTQIRQAGNLFSRLYELLSKTPQEHPLSAPMLYQVPTIAEVAKGKDAVAVTLSGMYHTKKIGRVPFTDVAYPNVRFAYHALTKSNGEALVHTKAIVKRRSREEVAAANAPHIRLRQNKDGSISVGIGTKLVITISVEE